MTIDELIESVRSLKWHLTPDGLVRCEKGDCPILAAYHQAGYTEYSDNHKWRDAAKALGLAEFEACAIVWAADTFIGTPDMRRKVRELVIVRGE
jgi:hypothetical protein